VPAAFPGFAEGVGATQLMCLAIVPATLVGIKTADLYAKRKASSVFGSHLLALGIGVAGIIYFGRTLGLLGLALSLLIMQCALAAALSLSRVLEGVSGRRIAGSAGIFVLIALALSSAGMQRLWIEAEGGVVRGRGFAMDTTVSITVASEDTQKAREAVKAAFDEILRVERLLSHTDEISEIYALNHAGVRWINLSPETVRVVKKSLYYAELSDGHFDPTVKPLVELWMKQVKSWGRLPTTAELADALAKVGWQGLVVDENNGRARFLREGMEITLGGIAKGYAVDRACEVLAESGVSQGLVDIGGDIRAFGEKSWSVAIQHPRREFEWLGVIELENAAVATSGDYRRFFLLLGEVRVHHILDPKTGQPADTCMSVTIVTENCIDADALSTSVFVLGPERGKELLDSLGVKGLIVASDGRVVTSEAWDFPLAQPA
jgi:thiamine biosynthesis lipoprotein